MLAALTSWAQAGIPIQHWVMPNGARVYLVEAPGLPMVDVQIDFDAGARRDPAHQVGLASATALMMSKGLAAHAGAPAMDENALGEAWADLGASLSLGASNDRFSVNLRSLTRTELLDGAVQLALGPSAAGDPGARARREGGGGQGRLCGDMESRGTG